VAVVVVLTGQVVEVLAVLGLELLFLLFRDKLTQLPLGLAVQVLAHHRV
jgi:hypothetical protein